MDVSIYYDDIDIKNIKKVEATLKKLPLFASDYFNERRGQITTKTELGYVYDFKKFFVWLYNLRLNKKYSSIRQISLNDLDDVDEADIEEYIVFLQNDKETVNTNVSIHRKISALSSFIGFYDRRGSISGNPCLRVEYPSFNVKENKVLNKSEISTYIRSISNVEQSVNSKQASYIKKTSSRDMLIIELLLSTGIRVNECVSLNIDSVNFRQKRLIVYRGLPINLPLSDIMLSKLKIYLKKRKKIETNSTALFLSMQNKRMCIQAVEDMVKKYSVFCNFDFIITPKTLRHTFASMLFIETNNSDLVSSYMGKKKIEDLHLKMNSLNKTDASNIYKHINSISNQILIP